MQDCTGFDEDGAFFTQCTAGLHGGQSRSVIAVVSQERQDACLQTKRAHARYNQLCKALHSWMLATQAFVLEISTMKVMQQRIIFAPHATTREARLCSHNYTAHTSRYGGCCQCCQAENISVTPHYCARLCTFGACMHVT